MVRFLGLQGADLDMVSQCGSTPVFLAAKNGFLEVVQLLATFGTNVNRICGRNGSARDVAKQNGHECIVVWLDAVNGWPALRMAASCRFYRIAQTMMQNGHADPDAPQYQ